MSQKAIDRTFKIKLRATNGNEEGGMTLGVSLPSTYPKSLPRLTLDFGQQCRQMAKKQAEEVLRLKPKSLLGSEIIYEIAFSLQEILNQTWVDPTEVLPLDEERAAKEQAVRAKFQEDDQLRREKEQQEENQEEKQLLRDLVSQRQSQLTKGTNPPRSPRNEFSSGNLPAGVLRFERPSCSFRNPEGRTITIDIVHDRRFHRQGPVSSVVTVRPFDYRQGSDTRQDAVYLGLKECCISSNGPAIKRAVHNLESKLEVHMGLSPHQSIIKPLNFQIQRTLREEESLDSGWDISILTELAEKNSLQETLEVVDKIDVKLIRAWSIRLLEGLHHYHRHRIVHANLHLGNILLRRDRDAEKGERKITVAMLSDGGYQRDLHLLKLNRIPQNYAPAWTAPEVINANASEEAISATDVWDFGRCFVQMAFGLGSLSEHASGPRSLIQGLRLTESLKALLNQVFHENPRKRSSAWDLLHSEFFRNDDALFKTDYVDDFASSKILVPSLPTSQMLRPRRESVPASSSSSRYAKDFVEDGRLGRGGFGEVFQARNRVDGQAYAIKKVKARSSGALDPVLSEVTVLSRLNHPNVVRYFASWIEDELSFEKSDSGSSGDEYTSSLTNHENRSFIPASSRGLDFISSSNAQIVFATAEKEEETSSEDENDSLEESEMDDLQSEVEPVNLYHMEKDSVTGAQKHATVKEQTAWVVLYIQMEFCKREVCAF